MKTVSRKQVATSEQVGELALPPRVQEALGELVSSAKEGLLALSVGVGLGVLTELLEEEVDEVVGPKGKHNPDRAAVRHGHDSGEATLGGRRVQVERPRVRSADGEREVPLRTYQHFADGIRSAGTCSRRCSPASPPVALSAPANRSSRASSWRARART